MKGEIIMDNIVVKVLKARGCMTSKEISAYAKRVFNESISPQSVSGKLRSLYNQGKVGSSDNCNGEKVYWWAE